MNYRQFVWHVQFIECENPPMGAIKPLAIDPDRRNPVAAVVGDVRQRRSRRAIGIGFVQEALSRSQGLRFARAALPIWRRSDNQRVDSARRYR